MLLTGGTASAQVVIEGNVFGGGNIGQVTKSTTVNLNDGTTKGSVYGGGKGVVTEVTAGLVKENTLVEMKGGIVERSIYGGGELGSVGTFTDYTTVPYTSGAHAGESVDVPASCAENTGLTKVIVNGGEVGVAEHTIMPFADNSYEDDYGYVFASGRGEADSITYYKAIALGVAGSAILEIGGTAFIHGSVYGGSEDGLVLGNTRVAISSGQIGNGYYEENGVSHWDGLYTEEQWNTAIDSIKNGTFTDADAADFHECSHWPYQSPYQPFDPYILDGQGDPIAGSNGYTTFGNVFGGGSGYYPIANGIWRRTAGQVNGNSEVVVTGGHILTSIFGGNEMTDVLGTSTVTMTGGTLGVPRTLADIAAHPVTCYLFGGGKGDQRTAFNTWTNVHQNVEVNIGGNAFFFGSVFGGGEDGHVLGNVVMNINNLPEGANDAFIGTWGYSYVDGNVFGGGRGFSGEALSAGSVGGNVTLNIGGGTMLGSIYGGGRLASVGLPFVLDSSPLYGQMQAGDDHGVVRVNITGGTIGNDYESKLHLGNPALAEGRSYGGNVFGGSMGRLTLLDGSVNPLWPNLGKVKNTYVTISGDNTIIKGNVYGGSELGTLSCGTGETGTGNATVTINGGTIWRNVFGGSLGSDNTTMLAPLDVHETEPFQVNPMQRAGRIDGNTIVNINGGWVKKSVYGGGELASVGTITELPTEHAESGENAHPFNLSWPYEFKYADGTGTCTVNVTGGRVGLTGKDFMGPWNDAGVPLVDLGEGYVPYNESTPNHKEALKKAREDNGDVFGGGKGIAGDRYVFADCANANNTMVTVEYATTNAATPTNYMPSDWVYGFYPTASDWSTYTAANMGCLPGSLYGGGENGHVNDNTIVTLNNGLIGHSVYGGGKGTDTYQTWIWKPDTPQTAQPDSLATITSITAGKVFGNTYVNMNGGYVVRNVFGGGNRASVGKGNYASGPNDFTPDGYGEQWTAADDEEMQALFDNSGHTNVNIYGGTIGTVNGMKDDIPTGNVFGSSRGEPAPNVPQTLTPRIHYYPEFFLGYTNHTHVTIGASVGDTGPRIYGSVFGGGQDGHVRWDANVTVNAGEIGNKYDPTNTALFALVGDDLTSYQWRGRGSVYGAGAGVGQYTDGSGSHYSRSAGSVTQFTTVTINGGTIHQNVYGGGPLSSVGPPAMEQATVPDTTYSLAKVNIYSAIGDEDVVKATETNPATQGGRYGGSVFGAGRGIFNGPSPEYDAFATTMFSEVNLYDGASVPGDVYGGGQLGQVKNDTKVNMYGGTVGTIGYVRKHNTASGAALDSIVHTSGGGVFGGGAGYPVNRDAALVKGNTEVNIKGGHVLLNVYGGGEMASVGLRDTIFEAGTQTIKDFAPKANTGLAKVTVTGGQVGPAPREGEGYNIPIGLNGVDGYVFGGGKGIANDYITNPAHPYSGRFNDLADVNNTEVTVNIPASADANTNRIWGSIFGGAEDGHVLGDAHTYYISGLMGTTGTTSYDGNIFGGGRNFSKANYNAGRVRGNITVEMSGGQIYGSIFGGGRLALTGVDLYGNILSDDGDDKYGNTFVKVNGGTIGNDNTVHDASLGDIPFIKTFTEHSMGDVYGGGKGDKVGITGHPHASALLVSLVKNTEVLITDSIKDGSVISSPKILGSVFGGGEVATVGQYTWTLGTDAISDIAMVEGTGKTKVTVTGGQIGLDRMEMDYTIADGEGNFSLKYNSDLGHVFGGGEGLIDNPEKSEYLPLISTVGYGNKSLLDLLATVGETDVTIGKTEQGSAWVKGTVYGGSMAGHVMRDTKVTISGGQIGAGDNGTTDVKYSDPQFFDPLTSTTSFDANGDVTSAAALAGCNAWDFDKLTNRPFNSIAIKNDDDQENHSNSKPTDGKTWYGKVFGGGSGFYPYYKEEGGQYKAYWNRESGIVYGNTEVNITGGHILSGVYGGCETTDVGSFTYDPAEGGTHVSGGTATVKMSGGTLGVPRTFAQIESHPIKCSLFGAGQGDPRTDFNTWTNVKETVVQITGGIVYGSVFGGGEDGHVFGDVQLTIGGDAVIGTTGRSSFDGNVFGGGRGFSGEALTAGVVAGNAKTTIEGGTMLGSVYGGGRMASVGTHLVPPEHDNYGKMQAGDGHGKITVNITGGTIGNDYESKYHYTDHTTGGNVFAGGMGRIEELDGTTTNPKWFMSGRVKNTTLNISQTSADNKTTIKGNVYGGGELGIVGGEAGQTSEDHSTHVNISGGTLWRDVYGGGHGSDNTTSTAEVQTGVFIKPVQLAARVFGNTNINISGGWIKKSVYGGGEFANVGRITDSVRHVQTDDPTSTNDQVHPFYLSWPFKFTYADNTGKANINVTGGRIGITGKDFMGPWSPTTGNPYDPATGDDLASAAIKATRLDNGDIYGGGKGKAGSTYIVAHIGNVRETEITINDATTSATPTTYQPSDWISAFQPNLEDWTDYGTLGCVSGAVYGGAEDGHVKDDTKITIEKGLVGHAVYGGGKGKGKYNGEYVLTSGKVYGNTEIEIKGGYVVRSVFGGGNLASVGKGNYLGYGETTTDPELLALAASSGQTNIKVYGGTLGMLNPSKPSDVFKDNIPYGSVFGGCRGQVVQDADEVTDDLFGFVNNTSVTIGETATAVTPGSTIYPRIYGSVHGGAQDGHVRRSTDVTVNSGEIGVAYVNASTAATTMGISDLDNANWTDRGNVFGGGSGKGFYDEDVENSYNKMAGSVIETTAVKIKGGLIHRNVYGGGNLATVFGLADDGGTANEKVSVSVSDEAKVGLQSDICNDNDFVYGGSVFGAGKGFASDSYTDFCNVQNTDVTVKGGYVYGDVYGGGENGHVIKHTDVKIQDNASIGVLADNNGGTTSFDGNVFGGGWGSGIKVDDDTDFAIYKHCGRVGGNTNVTMTGGTLQGTIFGGGRLALVGVDVNGDFTPYASANDSVNYGLATINVSAGSIGNSNPDKLLNGSDESVGDIFGSGKGDLENYEDILAGRVANTKINITGNPRIYGAVFGGGEMASIGYWQEVDGKAKFHEYSGTAVVTVGGTAEIGTDKEFLYGYAHGTGDDAPSYWTVLDDDYKLIHTCTGNVFGGAQGDVDTISPHWVSMGRSRMAYVTINDNPTIKSRVFGGAEQGTVAGDTRVTVNGGTIGTLANTDESGQEYYFGGVYGGGYGSHNPIFNGTETVFDHTPIVNDSTNATHLVAGNLWTANYLAGRVYGDTHVDILGGTIKGDVFGGASFAYVGAYGTNPKGNATVNIGAVSGRDVSYTGNASFFGSVYGANNHSGTPYGNVTVNVYQTAHTTENECPEIPEQYTTDEEILAWLGTQPYAVENFAIQSVYGGSNQADYTPAEGKKASVHVYQCQENTIREVYGGSNAADIGSPSAGYKTDANVIIDGGRIYRVFGGGNGEVRPSDIYGKANTNINGGLINQVFGGSNNNGIIDEINLNVNYGGSCPLYIEDVFSGGNAALVLGDVITTVECCNASYGNFYGGTQLANIYGDVTVNIFGATYNNLFAGSKGQSADDSTVPSTPAIPADIKRFPDVSDEVLNNPELWPSTDPASEEYRVYQYLYDNLHATPSVDLRGHGGNVTLNIFGGTINEAAYGGSDENGNIEGKIQVNVFNTSGTCDLNLMNLYGAGRNTAYTPNYAIDEGEERLTPEINVIHGTVKGSVFGGGKGATATTTASPVVNMGYDADLMGDASTGLVKHLFDTIVAHNTGWVAPTSYADIVKGEVYGGGELATVSGNTLVNLFQGTVGNDGKSGTDGNIFGGGKGSESSLTAGRVEGNTVIDMRAGTVMGNIYGGGRLAQTGIDENGAMQDGANHGYTKIMVKGGTVGNKDEIEEFTAFSMGNIYGGGKGLLDTDTPSSNSPEKSLLLGLTKNTTIEISDTIGNDTHVYGIVLGGGEIANVGQYTLTKSGDDITNIAVAEGKATVKISGGIIGGDRSQMRPDTDAGSPWLKYNDDLGYVYGGGEGWSDNPSLYVTVQENETSNMSLLDLVATVQSTEVTITNDTTADNTVFKPWVKASVFGGSESGHVRGNTLVTIKGGTIGAGDNGSADVLYTDNDFADPGSTTWYTTAHWPYAEPYTPFDPELLSQGQTPKDGRSWFGNVFGGGSGWFPYVTGDGTPGNPYQSYWNANSGKVWGNTEVIIEGGHILNNVYGANESTDVGGTATVRMSGGTVGVPRTPEQIELQPTTNNVFGGGAGDPRRVLNGTTNVASTDVQITGGTVYGSVFGGAEMGHVLGHANVTINEEGGTTVIGTSGLSGYDGNVFGGGKGDETNYDPTPEVPAQGETPAVPEQPNFACGRVGGNASVNMSAGTVLGNLYGGGMIARTGVGENGGFDTYISENEYDSINHGMTTVTLTGGTIGNNANDGLDLLMSGNDLGNVYGGGRGKLDEFIEDDYGRVANAKISISGSPRIYSSVFGGGQMANVGHWNNYDDWYTAKTGTTHVTITDTPTIGLEKEFDHDYSIGTGNAEPKWTWYDTINGVRMISHTCTGNVFGGGQGDVEIDDDGTTVIGLEQGHCRTTIVDISGTPTIMSSVFGGSEDGIVWGDTKIKIAGGTIGRENNILSDSLVFDGTAWSVKPNHATYSYGNVFGGSYGKDAIIHLGEDNQAIMDVVNAKAGLIHGNTYVEITGGQICGNVFGGSNYGTVVGNAEVKVSGTAEIGPLDYTGLNAYVYGGGKGFHDDPTEDHTGLRKAYANVANTKVTVEAGTIYGSVFGGGSDAHVLGNAEVNVTGGTLGTTGTTTWDGNIFGGGRNFMASNLTNGRVGGNVTVNMTGGTMLGSIFGGGRLANTGIDVNGDMQEDVADDPNTPEDETATFGHTYVYVGKDADGNQAGNILIGHHAGSSVDRVGGNVYGGAKGVAGAPTSIYPELAKVKETHVTIDEASGMQTFIMGSVFGSGEDGHVTKDTYVMVKNGQIGGDEYNASDPPLCDDIFHGNVYGGGRGLDTYDVTDPVTGTTTQHYSETAGEVFGNTNVTIAGGRVVRHVYGGGNLASVGDYTETPDGSGNYHTGLATVTITGGQVGVGANSDNPNGMVFGAGRGMAGSAYKNLSMVRNTKVTITGNSHVFGTVYGSGEDGHVLHRTDILIGNASIDADWDGATENHDGSSLVIGTNGTVGVDGNVYGAGRGLDKDGSGNYSPTAGIVGISTNIEVNNGTVLGSVYGGGRMASVGHEQALDTLINGTPITAKVPTDFGKATIHITGNAIIGDNNPETENGHVYGSGMGELGYADLTYVYNTDVTVNGNATVKGSVFGGGEVGHVKGHTVTGDEGNVAFNGDTRVTIGGNSTVGLSGIHDNTVGNVFGGGLGNSESQTAGGVDGIARTTIDGGTVYNNVFGGGNVAIVKGARVVNIDNGRVEGSVFGGNNTVPDYDDQHPLADAGHGNLKTVNVRSGQILGSVYGNSYNAPEGTAPEPNDWQDDYNYWSSFVNITGGTIDGNVYGAGYGGTVNGSVCINVGLTAVENAPTYTTQSGSEQANIHRYDGIDGDPARAKLVIGSNIFGGSYQYESGSGGTPEWQHHYDITGYSTMFIDGDGYETTSTDPNTSLYMNLGGGIYGSGNFCESGEKGREIILRKYGTRNPDGDPTAEMTAVSRTLTTLQRGGIVLFDNANIHFSGAPDISGQYTSRSFGLLQTDLSLYVANGSGIVLGTAGTPAYMDSIKEIRSLYLKDGIGTSYNQLGASNNGNWEMVGIKGSDNKLYRIKESEQTELSTLQENVILFNDDSRLWVRYKDQSAGKVMYGQLFGFFRMRADNFTPEGMESFAYARPKLTANVNPLPKPDGSGNYPNQNEGDGGFLSYDDLNTFTTNGQTVLGYSYTTDGNDGGTGYTSTKQYPYYNISRLSKNGERADLEEYREWVLPKLEGHMWYVDGTRGWGRDETHANGWGDYPDKPKLTLTGIRTEGENTIGTGVCNDNVNNTEGYTFNAAKDIIFVVGAVKASLEQEYLNLSATYPLKLFRYPGGHKMSNNQTDVGGGSEPADPSSYNGLGVSVTAGPGVNTGAMVDADRSDNFVMENVIVDGLYTYESTEKDQYQIPDSYTTTKLDVSEPLVVTAASAQLTLKGGTILQRGYNNTDASGTYDGHKNYYLNPDFKLTSVHNGGALFVDSTASVKVEGLLTISGNLQKNGTGTVASNVYLPTFNKHLEISDALNEATRIGITNPVRNKQPNYAQNTLSPVAVGTRSGKSMVGSVEINNSAIDANNAWVNQNFGDDLNWFFVNGHDPANGIRRTTYYNALTDENTLYLGWTWANVVREQPAGFDVANIDSEEDLAWLISTVNGLNGQTANASQTVSLKAKLDLQQYVWVPIGSPANPFSGTFDGQGHTIKNLDIAYTGKGDRVYEYSNFGLFGDVNNGTVNRTFVVSGYIKPVGSVSIGGLAALVEGANSVISNSEAAVEMEIPDHTGSGIASGGLVGQLRGGEVHSSMAMPTINAGNYPVVGGLVGLTQSGTQLNNSFAYPKFKVASSTSTVKVGGLAGSNGGSLKNSYVRLQTGNSHLTTSNYGNLAHTNTGIVDYCYGFRDDKDASDNAYPLAVAQGTNFSNCHYFAPVASSDNYGYMYMDNKLYDRNGDEWVKADTTLFLKLNRNIASTSILNDPESTHKYARWTRPTLDGINGDYPVLMLDNYDGSNNVGLGGLRSVASITGSPALQYGGPVRDASSTKGSGELDEAIGRMTASTDELLVYGDITVAPTQPDDWASFAGGKIAIHEDASILLPGTLGADGANVYVGVTFDNTSRKATDAYGNRLYRDWHMFSSPLANAPLGMDYTLGGTSEDQNLNGDYANDKYVYKPVDSEWGSPYSDASLPIFGFTAASANDGYFPSQTEGYTKPTGELYGYPYDFYTWYEPDWQWINFKRNGVSHWHFDETPGTTEHNHIDYQAHFGSDPNVSSDDAEMNVNETTLVPGKGYMMAIDDNTYMQSHGRLNSGELSFALTNSTGSQSWTWVPESFGYYGNNFVGNPYHAYLDFDEFGKAIASGGNGFSSYYTYDADRAKEGINYLIYAEGGSASGYYGSRYLHPHQGFFLQTDANKSITFLNNNVSNFVVTRSDADNSPFRDWRPAYPLVNLFAYDSEGRGDVVVIEFNRPENGGGEKAKTLRTGNHLIYAHNGDTDYGAFFAVEGTDRVPVRFLSLESEQKPYTLRWDTHNGFFNSLYLIDNLLGITYDMLENDSYTFVGSKDDYVSRFVIVFNVTDLEEHSDHNLKTFAFYDGSAWVVNGTGRLEVIDATGRILYAEDLHNEQNHVNLNRYAKGVYMLRLWNSDKARTQKIVLH